jgi:predicted HicB family RNase H-like nuclease
MTVKKQNVTLDPEVFEKFCNYAGRKGMKISTWVNQKMKEFIEEEEAAEAAKKKHS